MPHQTLLGCIVIFTCTLLLAAEPGPSRAGLVLWVDASNPASAQAGADGSVRQWNDLSGQSHHLQAGNTGSLPKLVPDALKGKPAIRFSGEESFSLASPLRPARGSGAILIVWQRTTGQVSDKEWQRLLSSRTDTAKPDNALPNFCMTGDRDGKGKAVEPVIYDMELTDTPIGALVVGRTAAGDWQFLRGDIAELLVYDRAFLSEGELQESLGYLKNKWGAKVAREENGWTRVGALPQPPRHEHQDRPLSDQENHGRWVLDAQFSDEFSDTVINLQRWHLNPTAPGDWLGREPALFDPNNVYQKDGQLHLVFRKGDTPEMEKHKGYAGYTSALIQTNELTGYGYYETRARPMNSAASSAFWFTETRLSDNQTEIDVFEIGGKAAGFEQKYNMNAHVWRTPQEKRHWAIGGIWIAPFKFADDFHVYGFEWNAAELKWYVDGVLVRSQKNTNWSFPMRLVYDSEAMWSWFGKVNDADLPSTFSVDYLRVWRQKP